MSLSTTSKWFLNTSRDGDSTTSLVSLFQCLTTPSVKEILLKIQPKPPLVQLAAIPPHPITCHQREETNPTLAISTLQILEESNNVSPQPPFPQTKQPQFLQSLLVGHILQALQKFFEPTPASPCPFCTEVPKTEHSTRGEVSPMPSTGAGSLP